MKRLHNITRLHQILSSHRYPVPLKVIQEELQCSRATAIRTIRDMRLYFHAPIIFYERGYTYDIKNGEPFQIPGLWLSGVEIEALFSVQHWLSQIGPGFLDTALQALKNKMNSLLHHKELGGRELWRRVRFVSMAHRRPPTRFFPVIATALLQRWRLCLHYESRSRQEISQRTVSPQRLVHYRDNWYLDAFCHLRQGLRSFSLDRIRDATLQSEPAQDIPEEELDAHFAHGYGIFSGPPTHHALLRFSPHRARWVADETWHPQQEGQFDPQGHYLLRVPYADPRELVLDILRYGPDVEVLEPEDLRHEVAQRIKAALKLYEKTLPPGSGFEPGG